MSSQSFERPRKRTLDRSFFFTGMVALASIFVCLWKLASAFDLL